MIDSYYRGVLRLLYKYLMDVHRRRKNNLIFIYDDVKIASVGARSAFFVSTERRIFDTRRHPMTIPRGQFNKHVIIRRN